MAKKDSKRELRKAKREIKKEFDKSLSAKDKRDMKKFKCYMKNCVPGSGSGGAFYFLGFIGALVYYLSTATSFLDAVVGFFQALFWPAFLVLSAMHALGM